MIVTTQAILTDVQTAEIAERGYRVVGGSIYLQAIRSELKKAPKDLDRFRSLTPDNPHQAARAAELEGSSG